MKKVIPQNEIERIKAAFEPSELEQIVWALMDEFCDNIRALAEYEIAKVSPAR